jgi:N-acetylglucosaminyl-diphospho-decaprenol L-rhamnosyltransferase
MIVSIIIVNWNTRDRLAACLQSIAAIGSANQLPALEIFVVDNASTDGSPDMVRAQFPQVQLIVNPDNVGFARANNQALRLSHGDYVLLLNSDTVLSENFLPPLIEFLQQHSRAAIAVPKLLNADGSFQGSGAAFPTFISELLLITKLARLIVGPYAPSPRPRSGEPARSVDWASGAALMLRRSAIDQVGLLDEKYFFYSEETEWCWRFRRAGWEVWYLPQVEIIHFGAASSRQRLIENYAQLYFSKIQLFKTAYGLSAARRLRIMFTVVAVCRLMVWLLISLPSLMLGRGPVVRQHWRQDLALLKKINQPGPT